MDNEACSCKPFCEAHGRDYVGTDFHDFGGEGCTECSDHGFSGELCWPDPHGCHIKDREANRWERKFMCWRHRIVHWWFCWRNSNG